MLISKYKMTNLSTYSKDDYYFFVKSKNVKASILETLSTQFVCDFSIKLKKHFECFADNVFDVYSEVNIILPHKKLKFITTRIEHNKLDYVISIKNNDIVNEENTKKKLNLYL